MRTILLALALAACGSQPQPQAQPVPQPQPQPQPVPQPVPDVRFIETADYAGVVVSAALAIRPGDFFGPEIDGHWDPGDDDIAEFEANLRADLKRPTYHRQYLGLVIGGAQKLYVSFFCDRSDDWRRPGASVDDGGDCYYQVLFDVATGGIDRVTFNGDG